MHLSQDDRSQYHEMVVNPENSTPQASSRMLVSKISNASVVRSRQTVITAAYVERLLKAGKSVILCGDFNDTPISYTRHRIASTGLTDAYVTTANGIGRSFNRDAIYVRIDNMFCSPDWKPYDCQVDASIKESDHYPISPRSNERNDGQPILKKIAPCRIRPLCGAFSVCAALPRVGSSFSPPFRNVCSARKQNVLLTKNRHD